MTYHEKEVVENIDKVGGLTRSGRCFVLESLRKSKPTVSGPSSIKKPITEEEAKIFLKKMKLPEYSILDQLKKTPAQISLLSLLLHSKEHRDILLKVLNEAYIPREITINQLEKMVGKIFEVNRISFSDDELPVEGTGHNRGLYIIVKCEDFYVTHVMIDEGLGANIFPISTLQKLNIGADRIRPNNLYLRRMAQAYNKKVYPKNFEVRQLVVRRILPHQVEAKSKFSPNWQGPFVVKKVLPNGALYLTDIEGEMTEMTINADIVKRYYVNDAARQGKCWQFGTKMKGMSAGRIP
ncbi:putative benzoate carboxyl methyltransferase-like [Capsicum annuum]|nr:putative benzoate carboxyl methyltransferase-like [Capsicum annuum]